ncbi:MAG: hypothetical protein JWR72_1606 [Flavisolibacter sp.]|nr:hypothetical protein [Flavisolibacter sp.]
MELKIPAIDNITEAAKDFLQKVITPPLEELGLLLTDQVKLWRFKNQVTILIKAENHLKAKGLKIRKVSLKVLTPMLEYGSLEEDETLQDKWAALLANTAKEGSKIDSTLYSHILSQLSNKDAEVFGFIYDLSTETQIGNHGNATFSITIRKHYSFGQESITNIHKDSFISIDNLLRLRLLKEVNLSTFQEGELMQLTDLGFHFMSAVKFR